MTLLDATVIYALINRGESSSSKLRLGLNVRMVSLFSYIVSIQLNELIGASSHPLHPNFAYYEEREMIWKQESDNYYIQLQAIKNMGKRFTSTHTPSLSLHFLLLSDLQFLNRRQSLHEGRVAEVIEGVEPVGHQVPQVFYGSNRISWDEENRRWDGIMSETWYMAGEADT